MAEKKEESEGTGLTTGRLYFAYGSNMNLDQMEYRCPSAFVVENVRLEDYRLAFCGRNPDRGVATILPEKGSHVDGVLWKITDECEYSLDRYEGYPFLYGKQSICVKGKKGGEYTCMVYVMNAPYKDYPSNPSKFYLDGILEGCRQNKISVRPVKQAVERTRDEITKQIDGRMQKHRKGYER